MDFAVKACRVCGKIFQARGTQHQCPECIKALDQKFIDVRNYIFDNPGTTMAQICEENDVAEETVLRWIRDGRLVLTNEMDLGLHCHSCGKAVSGSAGTLCSDCGKRLRDKVDEAARAMKTNIEKEQRERDERAAHLEKLRNR